MSGPTLSIVKPCFGQTGMEFGQNVVDLPRAAYAGDIGLGTERYAFHAEPENRSAKCLGRARGRRARTHL